MKLSIKSNYHGPSFKKTKIKEHFEKRLVFNFSFLTTEKKYNLDPNSPKINDKIRLKLLERIYQLSQSDFIDVLNMDRKIGLEKIPEKEMKKFHLHPEFIRTKRTDKCDDQCWIFRLGNKGRVLGKMNDNLFYIVKIDTDFGSYKH